MNLPFRWDIARREQLGRLPSGPEAESYSGFFDDLRVCAARVVSTCHDSDLVFVGRSPESVFDYLSGVLGETSWHDRLSLLNLSVRDVSRADLRVGAGPDVHILRQHLSALCLSPQHIATPRPVALVDLVASGGTFEAISSAVLEWAGEERFDIKAVTRRLRFVGITWRKKTSPNTWRWHQDAPWLALYPRLAVKNVSIPGRMWDYLGNTQKKVARTQPQRTWRDENWRVSPPRDAAHLESLRLALRVFSSARSREEQRRFASQLAEQPALSKPWLRNLIAELRRTSKPYLEGRHARL